MHWRAAALRGSCLLDRWRHSIKQPASSASAYRLQEAGGSRSALMAALRACSASRDLETGKQIHLQLGDFVSDVSIANTLINMYAKCGSMAEARNVFDRMELHNVVSWNSLIWGYAGSGQPELALQAFNRMQPAGFQPDARTFLGALVACTSLAEIHPGEKILEIGRAIHSQAATRTLDREVFIGSALVGFYSKCGSMADANEAFNRIPSPNVVSWTALITGFVENDDCETALKMFFRMQSSNCEPDARALVAALTACAGLSLKEKGRRFEGKLVKVESLERGMAIHALVRNHGCDSDIFVTSTLVDMYAKCGSLVDARRIFDSMPLHNVVSWTSMMMGYAENGDGELVLELFSRMISEGCLPNARTLVAALMACGSLTALEAGKQVHAFMCTSGVENELYVANALIDFYGTCGSMAVAEHIFRSMDKMSVVTWSALIAGYSHQGDTRNAFELFERMKAEGVDPNSVTFLSILTTCSHAGLVETGKQFFEGMSSRYDLQPGIEHYHCMIDVLGRANRLQEAYTMLRSMPFEADVVSWTILLGACRKWKDAELGKLAFDSLIKFDDKKDAAYLLMASLYGSLGMREDQSNVLAARRSVRSGKQIGQSWWTDTSGAVHKFRAGDTSHPQSEAIHAKMKSLLIEMKQQGYVSDMTSVVQNISDNLKEEALCGHSEKLAIACALINTAPKTAIRIVKNLRVCDDCHRATIVISKIEQRKIICRDQSRFHVFEDGKCSCGNFW